MALVYGGKSYLANWIIGLMPPRCKRPNKPHPSDDGWLHFCEPYFGGGAVLLANDPTGISEVVNDLNGDLIVFWRVLQSEKYFPWFKRVVEVVPVSEDEFNLSGRWEGRVVNDESSMVDAAVAFFIRCRQSLAGRMKGFTGITRTRTRGGMNAEVNAWLGCIEGLPEVHARLKRVLIRNRPAAEIIAKEDGPRTLFYLDPPYLHQTRATTGEYAHEMTYEQHRDLLTQLAGIEGRFLLSGYPSKLYDRRASLNNWNRHEKKIANHSAGGKKKETKTEVVWTNY